jgi:hypothetical protein
MRHAKAMVLMAALLLPGGAKPLAAVQRLVDVQQVPSDTLHDVALTTFEHGRPVIYYNPVLLQQIGPELAAFFLAHEYGHVRYGEAGAALLKGDGEWTLLRQQQELEADCYATALLADQNAGAIEAALRFFTRMGPFRFDSLHPSGSQRAAKILACLPAGAGPAVAIGSSTP